MAKPKHHNTRHGHWCDGKPTKTYRTWNGMLNRCRNKKMQTYQYYGGKGIKVCERWQTFENFLADVGEIPEGMTIDRIDNDGDYTPDNVRLVSAKQQANNRRDNVLLTVDGETKTVAEWCDVTSLSPSTIHNRIRWGWSPEDCISTARVGVHGPKPKQTLTAFGKTQTVSVWSGELGIPERTLRNRMQRGLTPEECLHITV